MGKPNKVGASFLARLTETFRAKIDGVSHDDAYYGGNFQAQPKDHGTTHISVIDKYGNAVAVTSTINL